MAEYKTGGYKISDIYEGGYSSLSSSNNYALKNNYLSAGTLGMTTDPRVANVLQEVSTKLSSGAKQIEVAAVYPEIFDSIPKQQLKEVHRLSKLTGIDVSLHAPVMDVSGIDSRNGFSESERELSERKVTEALLRAKELNPDGSIPVTFHSAEGIPGSQFLPPSKRKEEEKYQRLIAVNKESGRLIALEPEIQYIPGVEKLEKGKLKSPENRIEILNESEWNNSLNQVFFNQERAQEILGKNQVQIKHILEDMDKMKKEEGKIDTRIFSPNQIEAYNNIISAQNYLEDVHQQANALFSKAYKFGTDEQKHKLEKLNDLFRNQIQKIKKNGPNPFAEAEVMRFLINEMKESKCVPQMYVPIEKFAVEKSAQTFGNSAFNAYKQFKDKAPTLVIENPPAGFALSTGEDIKNIVKESREQFVKKAVSEGISESYAKKEAEKLIGATWDVGHINMLRKYGYSEEDIIKETEKIAPYLKHIHLSDNFGFEHTELPIGMGNVPLKKMMEKLGEKGFEAKKIIEAQHWWEHFKTSPFQEVLESTGSPVYSMKMAPYWNQVNQLQQGYFSGYETFGAGFSQLPQELGGQMPGAGKSRMSGRAME